MERRFHVFVRRCSGLGYHVEVLGRSELATFAEDVDEARADLAKVLARLLARDPEFDRSVPPLREVRIRRVEVNLRALQGERLLPFPLRLTVVVHAPYEDDAPEGSVVVRVPRLNVRRSLANEADTEAMVEEIVRQRLFMADASQLLAFAYDGDETIEPLTVSFRANFATVDDGDGPAKKRKRSSLAEACRDVTDEARSQTLDRAFARDETLATLTSVLTARRNASVVLVGPAGVGKSAIVNELAYRMVESDEASPLHAMELWATSGARLVAGMRYLGEWQARVQRMLDALKTRRAVLHIEDLSELFGSAQSESGMDIPGYLLPSIEAGELVVLCEASAEDLLRAERTHPAFVRALRAITVAPLEGRARKSALESVAARIARGKRVRFTDESLVRAEDLCERFGDGTALPGASVALLRAAVSNAQSSVTDTNAPKALTAEDVTRAFSERTGYPRALVDPTVRLDPDDVLARLRARVVGQDSALMLLRDLVVTLKTGMSDPLRPLGSFLFLGPTGVGKTESALSLAHYLFGDDRRVARFDMSEYAAPGSAQRLISDSPGGQGSLTRRVREQPFGVVLLDEIEKADAGVHDLLLQILGEGRLTDGSGRTVSFRNTVVVLTSNLGADTVNRSMGFSPSSTPQSKDVAAHYVSAAAQFFRPELLNRVDHIVAFSSLSEETVHTITRRAVESALGREGLFRRGVKVRYDDAVLSALVKLGYDPRYGARPLKRAIEQWVIAPIARVLAARGASTPREVELVVRGAGIAVAPTSTPEVSAMSASDVRAELHRRAERLAARSVLLAIEAVDAGAGSRARWLIERYASWCEEHEATVTIEPSGRLRVEGVIAAAIVFEEGTHEFEAGSGIARVRVRVDEGVSRDAKSDGGVRLYTVVPEPAVWDVATELERVGPWERAVEGEGLDRFVLARMANG
ncbi:MAG: ATP-dependent Clp protease ATP-binding subunit [Myxococcales bacterium]|nr:ATP-dependent Clp protease ATP-binding subunit [Myxococcales bacterium]